MGAIDRVRKVKRVANAFLIRLLVLAGLFAPALVGLTAPQRSNHIHSLAFSPDGQQLAVVRIDSELVYVPYTIHLANLARTVSLVDVHWGTVKLVVPKDFVPGDRGTGERYMGQDAVAFDAAGKSLLVRDFAGADVRRIDLASGKSTVFFTPPEGSSIAGMCLSADRTRLAVADQSWVGVIDTETGQLLVQAKAKNDAVPDYYIGEKLLAVSSDNRWVAVASGENVWLCDAENELERGVAIACQGPFAFVPGGQEIATVVKDNISYFDLNGQQTGAQDLRGILSEPYVDYRDDVGLLAFLPDGDRLIVTIRDLVRLDAELVALGEPSWPAERRTPWPFRPMASCWPSAAMASRF